MKNISPKKFPKIPVLNNINIKCGKAEIKSKSKLDLSLIVFQSLANVAYVLTKSKTCAANIQWLKKNKGAGRIKVLLVNSGNANAYTGKEGYINVKKLLVFLSNHYSCLKEEIIISSTGVIGEQLPMDKIMKTLPLLISNKKITNSVDWKNFARSILTTDTFPKAVFKQSKIGNKKINLIGIAKGSGMIAPNMATMLGYIFTDLSLSPKILHKLLTDVNEKSFNSITIDSDTSTNDMVCFFSTKEKNCKIRSHEDKLLNKFKRDLESLAIELAKKIVFDGEGAKKFIEVKVSGAKSYSDAKKAAFSIANSPLVKTAIAGEDANWGRIIMALGKANIILNQNKISLNLGNIAIVKKGELKKNYKEIDSAKYLKKQEIQINVELNLGSYSSTVWTCDLTKEYISINADYRS